jgi:ribonuclease BN (tRNA processing enzyme)
MRVEFLGSGGYFANGRRHTACVMLPEPGVIFDAGSGLYRVRGRLKTRLLHIFLSHAHLDHITGLTALLGPLLQKQIDNVRVYGRPETLESVEHHLFAEAVFPVRPGVQLVPLAAEHIVPGQGRVRHVGLAHPGGSVGYRVDWPDRSLAYITDTTVDGTYTDFVRGVDLLLHECYFPDERADFARLTGHSHTTPVVELAKSAGVGKLVLVHIDPEREDDDPIDIAVARAVFLNTIVADDLMQVDF